MIRILAHPIPPTRQQVVSLSQSPVELTDMGGGGDVRGRGTKSYDCEKAWPYIKYSILSGRELTFQKSAILFQIFKLIIFL